MDKQQPVGGSRYNPAERGIAVSRLGKPVVAMNWSERKRHASYEESFPLGLREEGSVEGRLMVLCLLPWIDASMLSDPQDKIIFLKRGRLGGGGFAAGA